MKGEDGLFWVCGEVERREGSKNGDWVE